MSNPFRVRSGPGAESSSLDLSGKLNEWLERSGPDGLFRTCGSCRQMARDPSPAYCHRYGMTPPLSVIMTGCDAHDDECVAPLDANP